MTTFKEVQIKLIEVGDNAQRFNPDDDRINDLAASIADDGLINPLGVLTTEDGYRLIYGHRRLEAVKKLGWQEVTARILTVNEADAMRQTFSENFYREDLTPVELAVAISKEYETGRQTIEQLAKGFHRSMDWVRRYIAVCEWPEDVLDTMHSGKVSMAAAANLALIEEDSYRQFLCRQAIENGATARATSAWLQAWRSMLPMDEAIEQPANPGVPVIAPMVPQAPCMCCAKVYRLDALSYIPACNECMPKIRAIGNKA